MNINDYQKESHKTAVYPHIFVSHYSIDDIVELLKSEIKPDELRNLLNDASFIYPAIGLVTESAEMLEKIKKVIRDQCGILDDVEPISKELGDNQWYCAELATCLNLKLDKIMQDNLDKLQDRQKRGVLHGSGGER